MQYQLEGKTYQFKIYSNKALNKSDKNIIAILLLLLFTVIVL